MVIDSQDGRYGDAHLRFPSGTFLDFLIYMLLRYFLPSFESVGTSGQEKKRKKEFSRWRL